MQKVKKLNNPFNFWPLQSHKVEVAKCCSVDVFGDDYSTERKRGISKSQRKMLSFVFLTQPLLKT